MKTSQKWRRPSRAFLFSISLHALGLPCLFGDLVARGSIPHYAQLPAADRVKLSAQTGYALMNFVVTDNRDPLVEKMQEAKEKVKALPANPS